MKLWVTGWWRWLLAAVRAVKLSLSCHNNRKSQVSLCAPESFHEQILCECDTCWTGPEWHHVEVGLLYLKAMVVIVKRTNWSNINQPHEYIKETRQSCRTSFPKILFRCTSPSPRLGGSFCMWALRAISLHNKWSELFRSPVTFLWARASSDVSVRLATSLHVYMYSLKWRKQLKLSHWGMNTLEQGLCSLSSLLNVLHVSYYLITGSIITLNVSFSGLCLQCHESNKWLVFFSVCVLWAESGTFRTPVIDSVDIWTMCQRGPSCSHHTAAASRCAVCLCWDCRHVNFVSSIRAFICETSDLICVSSQHQLTTPVAWLSRYEIWRSVVWLSSPRQKTLSHLSTDCSSPAYRSVSPSMVSPQPCWCTSVTLNLAFCDSKTCRTQS